MLTERVDFFSHDAGIFLGFIRLLSTSAGNWRGGWPPLGRSV